MYHTLLSWVYDTEDFETAIKHDVREYVNKMRGFFNLSFLDEKKKVEKLADNYQKLRTDVFFFQEFSDLLLDHLRKSGDYWVETNHPKEGRPDTLIMVKKKRFPGQQPKNTEEELKKMSPEMAAHFDKIPKTSFMFLGNFIFLGVHLSSKAEKNAKEVDIMLEILPQLLIIYPGSHIVCGGDVNSYYGPDRNAEFMKSFKMYPTLEKEHTTIKQRTKTQAQWKKAELKVEESKDKIMSTLKILDGSIVLINGDSTRSKSILPSDNHPFDHFAVVTTLDTSN